MSFGTFRGEVSARWLVHRGDDRNMELLEDFAYVDPNGRVWKAPRGSVVNGASIPEPLWSTVGPPFVGDYRRASVVHDVACDRRSEPSDDVHRMFYHAMRADGVGWRKANVMYQAVKRFGPRWTRSGGLWGPERRLRTETVLEFAAAVDEAARQVDEDQGLDAVERHADALLLEQNEAVMRKASRAKKSTSTPKKPPGTISRVRRIAEAEVPETETEEVLPQMESLAAPVRKQMAGTQRLRQFREATLSGLQTRSGGEGALPKRRDVASPVESAAAPASRADATAGEGQLTREDRLRLVDQALVLLEHNYVHRPLKEAMYAVNPVQQLRLLREQILQANDGQLEDVVDFHAQLARIFLTTRDLHTNYFLPDPFARQTAYLPFLVEDFFDADDGSNRRRFLVTRLFSGFYRESFEPGVEILRWNGVPIARAVEINGDRFAGSNPEARRARGLETLTVRPLIQSLPPDEDFVLVEYRTTDGSIRELRVDWLLFSPDMGDLAAMGDLPFDTAIAQGIDIEQAIVRLAKKVLFAPDAVVRANKMARRKSPAKGQGLASLMPDVLEVRPVQTEAGEFGYLRIRTFSVRDADRFVNEAIRLVEQLPEDGLMIDVRGNGGGLILAGEQLLQILTPRRIEPTMFQLRNTPLNRKLVEANSFLSVWRESMRQAVQTGATYSQGFPITPPRKANEIGQRYHGPVVLITDGLCYSTTDIFAAGFQDHAIGTIIGTDGNTGAGGANVWDHGLLRDLLRTGDSPYTPLPSNAGMRVSIRRTIRVGKSNGTVLEDLGVVPNEIHQMTREDLLNGNVDLLETAGAVLAGQPKRLLRVEVVENGEEETTLTIQTAGMDRLDFYANDRPLGSIDVEDGEMEVAIAIGDARELRLAGYLEAELVASRLVEIR